MFVWKPQVDRFGSDSEYSVLVFDNRGVGHSDTPWGPYTYVFLHIFYLYVYIAPGRTSGMAEDTIALLDYIGWTDKRGIHVVGISLGGMIAQGTLFVPVFFKTPQVCIRVGDTDS